ncbi:hypothetical protein D3C72_945560 [compost metagenome]
MNSVKLILLFFIGLVCFHAGASGTVVRNGGDPLFHFLEATRSAMIETLNIIKLDPSEKDGFCRLKNLNDQQSSFCRDFVLQIAEQLLRLNQQNDKTKFVLKENPLIVSGPDGRPMSVAARTELGASGVIEFHRDSIKLMAPAQILFLITHEFQHKVSFQNRFVTDNEVIGPFASGRELLDSVAVALVEVAKRRGKIGAQYELRDTFDCQIYDGAGRSGSIVSSPRMFLNDALSSYQTSMGRTPLDGGPYVPEYSGARLIFRMQISESGNCSEQNFYASRRKTELAIVRVHAPDGDGRVQPEEVLANQVLEGFNPICDKERKPFGLSHDGVQFTCNYYGSSGRTSTSL